MAKTVSLPESVYSDLVSVSKDLTSMAGKPISLSMTVYLLTEIYLAHVREPCARDALHQRLASSSVMSPEEFEQACDRTSEQKRSR